MSILEAEKQKKTLAPTRISKHAIMAVARLDIKNLSRTRPVLLAALIAFFAGVYSIYYGHAEMRDQQRIIKLLPIIEKQDTDYVAREFPNGAEAGSSGYYHYHPTFNQPSRWASLAIGQRDVHPFFLQINLLTLYSQIFNSALDNPLRALSGNFDLSFVFVFVFPLFIIGLGYDIISSEEERGTFRLLQSLSTSFLQLACTKLLIRYLLVLILASMLFLAALLVNRISLDIKVLYWFISYCVYFFFWTMVVFFTASLRKSSAVNACTLLGIWLSLTIVLPALLNMATINWLPVPGGYEIAVGQRQVTHAGWDKDKNETMSFFFKKYPEFADTAPITKDFSYKWYYAMQEAGDNSVEPKALQYMRTLRKRQECANLLGVFCPPVEAQLIFNRIAGTDLEAEISYLDSVKRFHNELKKHFYPLVFAEARIKASDYAKFPKHHFEVSFNSARVFQGIAFMTLPIIVLFLIAVLNFNFNYKELS